MITAFIICAALLVAGVAYAQTAQRPPPVDLQAALTYVWIGLWGALAGLVSFYQKVQQRQTRWFNIGELVGELGTSAFVGVVTGLLCDAAGFAPGFTWALVAITGHAGGRAVFWLERVLQKLIEKKLEISTDEEIHERK